MKVRPDKRYDLRWRRGDLSVLVVLCLVGAALLGVRAVRRRCDAASVTSLHQRRAMLARERIDPNTASAASMRRLPRIGPVKARAIVAYRRSRGHGAFRTARGLQRVGGIGPAIADRIAPYLAFGSLHESNADR